MTDSILPHLRDLERRGGAGNFLTPAQAAEAKRVFGSRVRLEGGFAQAERTVPIFAGQAAPEDYIAAVRLQFRPQDTLGHRDILGAALGLGLERSVLGDIRVEQGQAWLVCLTRTAAFITENLTQAGRVGLQAQVIPLEDLPRHTTELREQSGTVASLRLDAVLAEAFRGSRRAAEEWLSQGLVQLRHEECRSGAKQVCEGDIISVRGKGRVKLLQAGDLTRKGRIRVTIGHYDSTH